MNNALMFSRKSDNWSTPQALFDVLHAEFVFDIDAAATTTNAKVVPFYEEALGIDWAADWPGGPPTVWLNPPYSQCREFIAKAAAEAKKGCTVVCLVPSRTDTRWWHEHVWDGNKPRAGVEVRFLKGRVKFGDGKNSAPFPSVVIIFRPTT